MLLDTSGSLTDMSNTSSAAGCGINISADIARSGERPAPSGKRPASTHWRDVLCTRAECRRGKAPGEPYDGKRHVRFDEGTLEKEQWARLRHRHRAKAAGQRSSLVLTPPRQRPTLQTANVLNKLPKSQPRPSDCLGSPHALTKLDTYR